MTDTVLKRMAAVGAGRCFITLVEPSAGITPADRANVLHLYSGFYSTDFVIVPKPIKPLALAIANTNRVLDI